MKFNSFVQVTKTGTELLCWRWRPNMHI